MFYAFLAIGAGSFFVWLFTDYLWWNIFGWFTWLMIALGAWMMNMLQEDESLMKLLLMVAAADGEVDLREGLLLASTAKELGISEKKVNELAKEIEQGKNMTIPKSDKKKQNIVKKLVEMAKADGSVSTNELAIIKQTAKTIGLSESFVDSLL